MSMTTEAPRTAAPRTEAPRTADEFMKGLWKENPVFIQVLGMCPALAVTNTVLKTLDVMEINT